MTIVNVALTADRIGIVTDSAVVLDGQMIGITSKVVALPASHAVVSAAGSHHLIRAVTDHVCDMLPPASDAATIAAVAREVLRKNAPCYRTLTTLLVAGLFRDEVAAVLLQPPNFDDFRLREGVHLMPATYEFAAAARAPSDLPPVDSLPVERPPAVPWRRSWDDTLAQAIRCVDLQREQRKVATGGALVLTVISRDGIEMRQIGTLDFLEEMP
jgi:hypothetical protein